MVSQDQEIQNVKAIVCCVCVSVCLLITLNLIIVSSNISKMRLKLRMQREESSQSQKRQETKVLILRSQIQKIQVFTMPIFIDKTNQDGLLQFTILM